MNLVTILIISSMYPSEMNKENPFPAFTAPSTIIFLLNLSYIDEVALDANLANYI